MAQKEKKKVDKKSEKVLEEMEKISKEDKKKEEKKKEDKKKDTKKANKKEEPVAKKESWFHGVKSEFKKVRWPSKKEMLKYSIATICFILFFGAFFYLIELVIWLIQQA